MSSSALDATDGQALGPLLNAVALAEGWRSEWSWDGRFGCALTVVEGDDFDHAHATLATVLPALAAPGDMPGVPSDIAQAIQRTGGLRSGQRLYYGLGNDGSTMFALWWPWGGGGRASVRLFRI